MFRIAATAAIALAGFAAALPAQAQSFVQTKDWDVYVDLPTRFAYVKTPQRWVLSQPVAAPPGLHAASAASSRSRPPWPRPRASIGCSFAMRL